MADPYCYWTFGIYFLGLLKHHVVSIIYFCVLAYLLYLVYCVG